MHRARIRKTLLRPWPFDGRSAALVLSMLRSPPAVAGPFRYGMAVALAVAAVAVTATAGDVLRPTIFLLPFAAVALSAWLGGFGPALVATASSAVLLAIFLFEPGTFLGVANPGDALRVAVFFTVALLMAALAESLRSAVHVAASATARRSRERSDYERRLDSRDDVLASLAAELESTVRELRRERQAAALARAEAEVARGARSHLMAVMSHELRTPLNAIIGYQELLEVGISGPVTELQREHLGRIGRSARHLLELIEQVLAVAQLDEASQGARSEPVALAEIAGEIIMLIRPVADRKGLDLDLHLDGDAEGTVLTDPDRLRQLLLNLVANAVEFTERGGVCVEASLRDGEATVTIRDTGPGIPAEHQAAAGAALGLAVARRLADSIGVALELESIPGTGSAYTIRLPAQRTSP